MKLNYKNHFASVAGVTFDNDDGTSRQEIMKNLVGNNKTFISYCDFKYTTFEDEMAIEVYIDKQMIGYVPRTKIEFVRTEKSLSSGSCICKIEWFDKANAYVANLYTFGKSAPTRAQIDYAKIVAKRKNINLPSTFSFDAYRDWLLQNGRGWKDPEIYKKKTSA